MTRARACVAAFGCFCTAFAIFPDEMWRRGVLFVGMYAIVFALFADRDTL